MFIENKELEKYIEDHTEAESDLLYDLNRQTHMKILRPRMLSGHVQGKFLRMLSFMIQPKRILEIGTYTGYSALCMADGMQAEGELHTIDINDELEEFTHSYLEKSNMKDRIHFHIGDAREIVPKLDMEFDLSFIDGDKRQYPEYFEMVLAKTRKGGFILADNILWDGKVLEDQDTTDDYTRGIQVFNKMVHEDDRVENCVLPIRDGIMFLRKK